MWQPYHFSPEGINRIRRDSPTVADAEKDLADYDTEIVRLETTISALKHKRTHLERYLANCRSLLSPIRRLPLEILTLVFLYLCREPIKEFGISDFDIALPAFDLSQVCAIWREVALNTPAIWSNVLFDLKKRFCFQQKINLSHSLIRLCLERSSQVPLNLTLSPDFDMDTDSDRYATFHEVLRPTSHRWRSLTISPHTDNIASLWSQITDLSSLESLEVAVETLELLSGSSSILCQASHLHSLHLSSFYDLIDSTDPPRPFPWAQISTLSFSWLPSDIYLPILCECPNLTNLFLWHPCGSDSEDRTDLITLDRLNHWEFNFYWIETLNSDIFSMLTAPALKHLTIAMSRLFARAPIDCTKSETRWPLDIFSKFAARSRFSLTTLCIDSPIAESDFLSLLRLFPDLTELDITEPYSYHKVITDNFLNGLHPTRLTGDSFEDRSTTPCIPRLLHLSLYVHAGSPFRPETLIEMVKSRWIPDPLYSSQVGIACLRSIKVIGDKRATEEPLTYKPLMELEKVGLRVEIL
ncbi:hypothetical protein K435DRAFT_967817 [Dendrothele bispora CBS 962.96]|uniref:Uncharacterized protein n=1 Tax=Dendrothele bispora (strain CBS 962.96) TaxID=1314807 RepID=A0A4S8LRR5_DENBC|nr:hypothetical protein K435DRAFT_967817 [Dendrothele bispora CBS 962.96]